MYVAAFIFELSYLIRIGKHCSERSMQLGHSQTSIEMVAICANFGWLMFFAMLRRE